VNAGGVDVRGSAVGKPLSIPERTRDVSTEGGWPKLYPDYNTSKKGIDSRGIKNGRHRVLSAGIFHRPGTKPNKR
jgi:hypothetical protein